MGKKYKRQLEYERSEALQNGENIYNSIIKEFSSLSKSKDLVVGTNKVLRLLQRGKLAAVFLFSYKASPPIHYSLSEWCKASDVSFIILQERVKFILSSDFPASISYGIPKKTMKTLSALEDLLKQLNQGQKNKKQAILSCDVTSEQAKLSSVKESVISKQQTTVEDYTFHHTHNKPIKRRNKTIKKPETFIALSDDSKRDSNFPDYDSFIYSKIS
ncbi:uncharacterized protein TNIN_117161 [Trichonephila inaurata madagascariensis]|uniref:Uncharacterized protein n=1 Tax=Trichonephila inaurata madagascariensis TaxID=2747483 RepID=A0A8X7BPX0_9ARAC|nr:uncharacterized protein TNIN_117161 [Trichonephila inaurata madagascariensis]